MPRRRSAPASWLLLSLLGVAVSLEVSESPGSVQVARGQTAVLPCAFSTSAALINLNVIWMVIPLSNANQPEQVILYQGGQMFDGAPRFHGRVGFTGTMPATNVSIFINNTQLSDTGTYQCLVNNLPDRGGRNIGVAGLTVLVPPSAPHCQIQGSQDIGSDVILLCSSEEGIPRPTYLWEKLDNTLKLPPTATQDQVQGTVTIRNISALSSGLYQCVASNAIGTSTCLLDLQVISPQPRSVGVIAGAVGTGVVLVIICIALISGAFFYWRSKNKEEEEEEIPNEIREDDLPPKCSSAKAFHTEISSSENNTLTSSNTYNSRYWNNHPKTHRNTESFNHVSDLRQSFSGNAVIPSIYANGNHLVSGPHKTLVVTTNRGSSPQVMPRNSGSVSRKPWPQHTHSYNRQPSDPGAHWGSTCHGACPESGRIPGVGCVRMPCPEEDKWNASRQGGAQGWVSAGKIDFCYDYISKKHQEGGAIAWPLQCVRWPGIFRHEDSRRLFPHHSCPGIQFKKCCISNDVPSQGDF